MVSSDSSKKTNKWIRVFLPNSTKFFHSFFWKNPRIPKSPLKIIWPLVNQLICQNHEADFLKFWVYLKKSELYWVVSNFKWKIFSNFVPFSEGPNFKSGGGASASATPEYSRGQQSLLAYCSLLLLQLEWSRWEYRLSFFREHFFSVVQSQKICNQISINSRISKHYLVEFCCRIFEPDLSKKTSFENN